MKAQQLVTKGCRAFGENRHSITVDERLMDGVVDARGVAMFTSLYEQRSGARREPANHGPAPDFGLRHETHVPQRVQHRNVEPRHVIGDADHPCARARYRTIESDCDSGTPYHSE